MRILISGSTGLVGSAASDALRQDGHDVTPLVRSPDLDGVLWDVEHDRVGDLSGYDAVVHLAGENIAGGRWTEERKRRIRDSRVKGTTLLARAMRDAAKPPSVFVSASAIGIYGDRGDEELTEESTHGEGFLTDVAEAWEAAAQPIGDVARLVTPRIGVVLAEDGGALGKMLLPFKLGVGGTLLPGTQWMSWIALDDLVHVIVRAVTDTTFTGIYNAVAPNPVRNREFTKALGKALGRPTILPVPAFALRLALGREFADSLLLASTRVAPTRLTEAGFEFEHPEIDEALGAALQQ